MQFVGPKPEDVSTKLASDLENRVRVGNVEVSYRDGAEVDYGIRMSALLDFGDDLVKVRGGYAEQEAESYDSLLTAARQEVDKRLRGS